MAQFEPETPPQPSPNAEGVAVSLTKGRFPA